MKNSKTGNKLSLIWLIVTLNMILADVLSLVVATVDPSVLEVPGDVKMVMAVAAVMVNIPILMIALSKLLPQKKNRILNIVASIITILFVVGGASLLPHYYIIGAIEVILLVYIISIAWRWRKD